MLRKVIAPIILAFGLVTLISISLVKTKVLKETGQKSFAGIKHSSNIHFDQYGVPHIEGKNVADVYFSLGYVMASERLFQMDLYRRLAQGRLSEIFGNKTIKVDRLMRSLQFKSYADKLASQIAEESEVFGISQAFLAGTKAFIDEDNLPIEFLLLGYTPEPFEIADMIGLTFYMALSFAEGLNGDVYLSELREKLPESKLNALRIGDKTDLDYFPEQKVVRSDVINEVNQALEDLSLVLPEFHGSNSWVLSAKRSESGYPILANDPHIGVSNPHVFYEAHIKTPDGEVYGNYLPLMPFPVMGHTPFSAWGLTMAELDDFNVYLEKLNPDDPSQVMFNNEWVQIEEHKEIIKVKGQKSEKIVVRRTPHGPMIDNTTAGIKGKNLSIHWSIYHPENNVLGSLYSLPRARTVQEFKSAVSQAAAPSLNITWVNKAGDIAWWVLGKYPKLPEGVQTDLVLRGWDGSHEPERYYEIDENPHLVNPESGVIVSANYRPQQEQFSHFQGYWQPAGRYFRLEQLLSKKEKWSIEDLKKVQLDIIVPIHDQLTKKFFGLIKRKDLTEDELKTLDILKKWKGSCDLQSIGCSIYHTWNYHNTVNLFRDEMGQEGFEKFGKTADFWHAYKYLVYHPGNPMWDDVKTDRVESGSDIVTRSFKDSHRILNEKHGSNRKRWMWGKLHKTEYIHPLGRVKPLNMIFNIGPVESVGGRYVINNLGHRKYKEGFDVVHAPATRRLIDMKNPKSSLGVLPTGNSGNPFSSHYADQLKLYHSGKYREQLMDWERIRSLPKLEFKGI